jgi:hypothetical protein
MNSRTMAYLLLGLVAASLVAGVTLVVIGSKFVAAVGVALLVVGLVIFMPAVNYLMESMGADPAE